MYFKTFILDEPEMFFIVEHGPYKIGTMINFRCIINRIEAFPLLKTFNMTIGGDSRIFRAKKVNVSEIEIHQDIRATEDLNGKFATCQVTTESRKLVRKAVYLHTYSMLMF